MLWIIDHCIFIFKVPLTEFEADTNDQKGILISAEIPMEGNIDDSQEAAEAMVQLGSMGFYQQGEINEAETLMFKG